LGSGFIISSDGYILTNTHVVEGADKITIRLTDKREFNAKVVGTDKFTDVALLKIETKGLPKIARGDASKLKVGEWVVAIGSPFGFDNSVTAGIISAKNRSFPQGNFVPLIQTDVAINPGNSGGPLFNMNGEVVGINSQIYTRSGGSVGLSFAIPIDVAIRVANQLRSSGKVTRGNIGVTTRELTSDLAESFGLSKDEGTLISSVGKNSPADQAGIEVGDVILKFDGKLVKHPGDLPRLVSETMPGSKVAVNLWRKGSHKRASIVVGELADENRLAYRDAESDATMIPEKFDRLGITASELSAEERREQQAFGGLLVGSVISSPTRPADLYQGDVLVAIGNSALHSVEQLHEFLSQVPHGRSVALLVKRNGNSSYITVKLDEE
jgi:serine protease Do